MRRLRQTFQSLSVRNYRLFFSGQVISVTGNWMQKIGQAWLVLEFTGSGVLLGVTAALQHVPTVLIGPWGGVLADRHNKRNILYWTSGIASLTALTLGILTIAGVVEIWMILVLAVMLGIVDAIDKPTRQAFIVEMVGSKNVMNATTLSTIVQQSGKMFGPALAGALIATVGLASSFMLNAVSFVAVMVALFLMRTSELEPSIPVPVEPRQLRAGLRYVGRTTELLVPLVLMVAVGTMAYEWMITLPLFASETFGGDAGTFAMMFSAIGAGAIVGGIVIAGTLRATMVSILGTMGLFSAIVTLTALSPTLTLAFIGLFLIGATSMASKAVVASYLQIQSLPEMRGRVLALLAVTIGGTTTIGGPLVGWIGESFGARVAVAQGGVFSAIGTLCALWYLQRKHALRPAGGSNTKQSVLPSDLAPFDEDSVLTQSSESG
jgi:MFS family permease